MAAMNATDMADLRNLKPLAGQLNSGTDGFNQSIQTIENEINGLNLGLEAWVEDPISFRGWDDVLDRNEEPSGVRTRSVTQLGYGRFGDRWALLVRDAVEVEGREAHGIELTNAGNPRALLRASRADRIASVPFLQALIDEIERQAKDAISKVSDAKKIADSLK